MAPPWLRNQGGQCGYTAAKLAVFRACWLQRQVRGEMRSDHVCGTTVPPWERRCCTTHSVLALAPFLQVLVLQRAH